MDAVTDRGMIGALADALDEASAGQTVDVHLSASARALLATPERIEPRCVHGILYAEGCVNCGAAREKEAR